MRGVGGREEDVMGKEREGHAAAAAPPPAAPPPPTTTISTST